MRSSSAAESTAVNRVVEGSNPSSAATSRMELERQALVIVKKSDAFKMRNWIWARFRKNRFAGLTTEELEIFVKEFKL